ncbi:Cas10/Cmr2 second palm domain-containing protein [Persicobacter psychrovividus]|uniref:Cas10/Cmr2 second palm domain-containing protein n=1 Tax=Persicobacter psychrovividus TaxID=387638 RepID=A0ABM7VM54_9BACT|nr:hypothetical protein PEPS_43440 [Persicobacter psychrovividus]
MNNFLYGASVNGIQSFIFKSNKLRDIGGASELVEQLCTTLLNQVLEELGLYFEQDGKQQLIGKDKSVVGRVYQRAAGSVKCLFFNQEDCQAFALKFPLAVRNMATGVSVSQAVVKVAGEPVGEDFYQLEKGMHLDFAQKGTTFPEAWMGIRSSRETALPLLKEGKDEGTLQKQSAGKGRLNEKFFGKKDDRGKAISVLKNDKSWMAVIHADGNGLGQVIQTFNRELNKGPFGEVLGAFSRHLDIANENATRRAVDHLKLTDKDIVPIILGGDDLTLAMSTEHSLEFVKWYSRFFEEETKAEFKQIPCENPAVRKILDQGLTVCAGIAFIKKKYPMHYGLHLAEGLCKEAKKVAKSDAYINKDDLTALPPSCLMFHRVESSFVEDYKMIEELQLTSHVFDKNEPVVFKGGPYFLSKPEIVNPEDEQKRPQEFIIDDLLSAYHQIVYNKEIRAHLRTWVTEMFNSKAIADQHLNRMRSTKGREVASLGLFDHMDFPNPAEKTGVNNPRLQAQAQKVGQIIDILSLKAIGLEVEAMGKKSKSKTNQTVEVS